MDARWMEILTLMDTLFRILTFIAGFGSLFFVWKGFQLARNYLSQHDEKLTIEKRRLAAENGLRAMLKVEIEMKRLDYTLHLDENILAEIQTSAKVSCTNLPTTLMEKSVEKVTRLGVFYHNYQPMEKELAILRSEVELNGTLLKAEEFNSLWMKYNGAILKFIITCVEAFQLTLDVDYLEVKDLDQINSTPEHYTDHAHPLVSSIEAREEKLKEFFLSKV